MAHRDTKKERNINDFIFLKAVCSSSVLDRVSLCIYWTACLQTVRLDGCQHRHSLPRIDPPTALLLSALLCCIDVFSKCIYTRTDIKQQQQQLYSHSTFSTFIQFKLSSREPDSDTHSVTPLIFPLLGGIALPRSNESTQAELQL